MEPFRPWVDYKVKKLFGVNEGRPESLTPELKKELASVLLMDFSGRLGASPMQVCMDRMAQSLAQVFTNNAKRMEIPGAPMPLTAMAES